MEVKVPKKLILILVPSALFSFYYFLIGNLLEAIITLSTGLVVMLVLRYVAKKKVPTKIDYNLVTTVFHMYGLSMGETSPSDLVETIAENKEYGVYSNIFKKILNLAKKFGYGLTRSTMEMAEQVKPPLKDLLVRCTTIFSSVEPKGYLKMESSTLMQEYSGYYSRAIESLKTIGGIFTTFQSVIVFLIMTLAIMTVFMIDPSAILFGYVVAIASLLLMYFLFKTTSPEETVVYIGRYPPYLYNAMRWSLVASGLPSVLLAAYLYFTLGAPFAFIVLGVGFILPGIFGYKLENYVKRIDRDYPTFLKALGEHMASTSNLKASLSYVLYMELGSLHKLVKRALARLKLGISHAKTLAALATEAASYQVHISNRILLDSLNRGADALEIGNALGNRVVAFMQNRRKRELVAKSFQMIMVVMQVLTTVLLVVLRVLSEFLSASLVGLPYFGFNEIPIVVIEVGNLALVLMMAIMNALIVKEASAGYWGTFFFNLAILLILSGVGWIVADLFVRAALGSMPTVDLPV